MNNYNELSDFEVNGIVAGLINSSDDEGVIYTVGNKYHMNSKTKQKFDPCNNPADAWPIIVENHITLQAYATEYSAYPLSDRDTLATNKNPLRAAMIVFLKMKDSE